MRVLVYTHLYPSTKAPTRGVFNVRTFAALGKRCDVRVVAPVRPWTSLREPRDLLSPRRETVAGLEAVYPPFLSVPRACFLLASGMYYSLRERMRRLRDEF